MQMVMFIGVVEDKPDILRGKNFITMATIISGI
jgi:hypothetical protein